MKWKIFQKAKDGDSCFFNSLVNKIESKKLNKLIREVKFYRQGCMNSSVLHIAAQFWNYEVCKILIEDFKFGKKNK
jgi:hypothetical protein